MLRAGDRRIRVGFSAKADIFVFSTASRPVLGPTQYIQWVPGAI
jgi:hypothetical protein